jgi:hypothetical protein
MGLPTTSDQVREMIRALERDLAEVQFGTVGLVFDLHRGMIVKVRQIREKETLFDNDCLRLVVDNT